MLPGKVMDAAFDFFLPPHVSLDKTIFKPKLYEWGGEVYEQEIPEFFFGQNFKLKKTPLAAHYVRALPNELQHKKWSCYSVHGKGLDIFRDKLLFGYGEEEPGYSLSDLVAKMLNYDGEWVVIFEPEYDWHKIVKQAMVNDIIEGMIYSFKVEKRGYIYYGATTKNTAR